MPARSSWRVRPAPYEPDIATIADAIVEPTDADLVLFSPGSAAYLYVDGLKLITAHDALSLFDPTPRPVVTDESFSIAGTAFDEIVLDGDGLVSDLNRAGIPLSQSVYPIFEVYESDGLVGTVHSVRYFDGNLQVLTLTENNSSDEGYIQASEFVSEGRQIRNVFGNPVRPTVVNAYIDTFEDAPLERRNTLRISLARWQRSRRVGDPCARNGVGSNDGGVVRSLIVGVGPDSLQRAMILCVSDANPEGPLPVQIATMLLTSALLGIVRRSRMKSCE